MNILQIGNELMCHDDKIPATHLFNRIVINDVLLQLQQNGYQRFMWLYDISGNGGALAQITNRYAVLCAYPYYPNTDNNYLLYLDNADDYLMRWIDGANSYPNITIKVVSSTVKYPLLNTIFEEQGVKVKFPCYYAAVSTVIEF